MQFQLMRDGVARGIFNASNILIPDIGQQTITALQMTSDSLRHDDLAAIKAPLPDIQKISENGVDSLITTYRMLSESYVYQMTPFGIVCISFAHKNVLKNSLPKIVGRPVMTDHADASQAWVGKIIEASWSPSINDIQIPGINGKLALDIDPNVNHPSRRIVRGVEQGVLNCFSVSVWFVSAMSHPNMDIDEFYSKQGKPGPDGKIVCFVAEDILSYQEGSVVLAGADPNAVQKELSQSEKKNVLCSFSSTDGWTFHTQLSRERETTTVKEPDMKTVEELTLEIEQKVLSIGDMETTIASLSSERETLAAVKEELSAAKVIADQKIVDLQNALADQVLQSQNDIEALKTLHASEFAAEHAKLEEVQQAFDAFKQDVAEKVAFADATEVELRADTERVYRSYATLLKSISDATMQTRLRQIKENMTIAELQENRRVWNDEIEAMLSHNGETKLVDKKVVDKKDDGVYGISKTGTGLVR